MKKLFFFTLAFCLIIVNSSEAQKSSLLKKVGNSMANELLGRKEKPEPEPEPACACDKPDLIFDLGGKLKLDYSEINVSVKDDGSIMVKDIVNGKFYIVKEGATQGPITSGDPRIAGFENTDEDDNSIETSLKRYKEYLSKSGDKYVITFEGKTYGPYAQISNFCVTRSRGKFAAVVIETLVVNEDQGKKMEEEMKKAKTDQEKMDLAMKYGAEMQQRMMDGGGPGSTMPKVVTNVEGSTFEPIQGGSLSGTMKYDDILVKYYNKVTDMKGNTITNLSAEVAGVNNVIVSSGNDKYAVYNYGTLTFSDKTTLSSLFNPHLIKVSGQTFLAYMYYSPKKNSIMQCKIPF
jgi:hypothetical protein